MKSRFYIVHITTSNSRESRMFSNNVKKCSLLAKAKTKVRFSIDLHHINNIRMQSSFQYIQCFT